VVISHEATTPVTVSGTANVSDPAVIPTALDIKAVEGTDTGLVTLATFTDPGGPESLKDYAASIDWGDGSPATNGTITVTGGVFTVQASHKYAEESADDHAGSNPYQLSVVVSHEAAPATTIASTATVSDPAVVA